MDKAVELLEVAAIDPEQVICLSGQRPDLNDLRLVAQHGVERFDRVRVVPVQGQFDEGLDAQAQPLGIKLRAAGGDEAFLFKPQLSTASLRDRRVDPLGQLRVGQ